MTPGSKAMINSLLDENPNEQLKALGLLMMSVLEEVKGLKERIDGPNTLTGTLGSGYGCYVPNYGNPNTVAIYNTPSKVSAPSTVPVYMSPKAAAAFRATSVSTATAIAQKQQQAAEDIRNAYAKGYIDTGYGTLVTDEDEPPVTKKKPLFDRIFGND